MKPTESRTIISILILTMWKGVGMVLSIAVAMGIANLFGATAATDAYFFARKLVSNIAMGFERTFHLIQVPPLIQRARREGMSGLRTHLAKLSLWTCLITCALSGLGIVFAPQIVGLLAPGFDEDQIIRTVPLLQILLLTIPISAVTGLGGATLNALRLFSLPAVARLLPRLFVLLALVAGPAALGIGLLSWAALIGTVFMGAFFAWAMIRALRTSKEIPQRTGDTQTGKYGRPRLFAMVLAQIHMIGASWIDMAFATVSGAGGIAMLEFGQRLTNIAPGVASNSITTVYYTEFSEAVSDNDNAALRNSFSAALRTAFFFAVPLAAITFVLASPAVDVIFRHGAFTDEAASTTTLIVKTLALLLPVNAVLGVTVSAIFADPRLPHIKIIVSSTIPAILIRVALAAMLIGSVGVLAVPISSLVAMSVLFAMCFGWFCVRIGRPFAAGDAIALLAILVAGALCFGVAWSLFGVLSPLTDTRLGLIATMGVVALVAALTYLIAGGVMRIREVTLVTTKIARKLRR